MAAGWAGARAPAGSSQFQRRASRHAVAATATSLRAAPDVGPRSNTHTAQRRAGLLLRNSGGGAQRRLARHHVMPPGGRANVRPRSWSLLFGRLGRGHGWHLWPKVEDNREPMRRLVFATLLGDRQIQSDAVDQVRQKGGGLHVAVVFGQQLRQRLIGCTRNVDPQDRLATIGPEQGPVTAAEAR